MSATDVEISIVNHENRALVGRCLASLPAACEGLAWHATVIDNVSGDGSLEMLASEHPEVGVIANRVRRGFGANHNQVLRRVLLDGSARYVLVLNDDTELEPGAVTRMARALDENMRLAAVVPTIVDREGVVHSSRFEYPSVGSVLRFDLTGKTEAPNLTAGWIQGCCLLMRVAALEQVGVFDDRFFLFWEDTDLSRRLEADGWRLDIAPEARVVHVGHASVFRPDIAARTHRQGLRSRYLYFSKYQSPGFARAVSFAGRVLLAVRAVKSVVTALVRRDPTARTQARLLWDLVRYDPRVPAFAEVRDEPVE
jgi:GT2 family glycosyltransferase